MLERGERILLSAGDGPGVGRVDHLFRQPSFPHCLGDSFTEGDIGRGLHPKPDGEQFGKVTNAPGGTLGGVGRGRGSSHRSEAGKGENEKGNSTHGRVSGGGGKIPADGGQVNAESPGFTQPW